MTLLCTKSKTTLFTPGNSYEAQSVTTDYDKINNIRYIVTTERGSTCCVSLVGGQAEFRVVD